MNMRATNNTQLSIVDTFRRTKEGMGETTHH
jgi:hypothetical protein